MYRGKQCTSYISYHIKAHTIWPLLIRLHFQMHLSQCKGHIVWWKFYCQIVIAESSNSMSWHRLVRELTHWGRGKVVADGIFNSIFLNENVWISLQISLKFVAMVRINNISALLQIMAWRLPGDKPLSEPMMVSLLTHICVTWPQWVNNCQGV